MKLSIQIMTPVVTSMTSSSTQCPSIFAKLFDDKVRNIIRLLLDNGMRLYKHVCKMFGKYLLMLNII
jgi:hypothetical protein